jgi:hypothetical protein
MRIVKLLVLAMLAVLTVCILATAPASAAACKAEPSSGSFALCITTLSTGESLMLIERTVGFLGLKQTKTAAEWEVESLKSHVVCFNVASTGMIEPTANNVKMRSLTIAFENDCHLIGAESECNVTEPITTASIEASITLLTKMPDLLLKSETGTFLWTEHITGAECEDASTVNVTGEQLCVAPALEEDSVEQLLECLKTGSFLFSGTKPFALELSEMIDLHPPYEGDRWSIIQGS